ncbi:MAG: hypothetical protein ACOCXM_11080 [Myxococcota bacterium]
MGRTFGYGLLWTLAVAGCSTEGAESQASTGDTVAPPGPVAKNEEPSQAEPTEAPPASEAEEAEPEPAEPSSPVAPNPKRPPPSKPARDPQAACDRAGGKWRQFPNTCVDSCRRVRSAEPVLCGMAMTMGCDCGSDRCWDGAGCVPIGTRKGRGDAPRPLQRAAPDRHPLVVQFTSVGAGTDRDALRRLEALIREHEAAWGTKIAHRKRRWGREGESDHCFPLDTLSEAQKQELIRRIRAEVAAGAPTVRVLEGGTCRPEPPAR